MRMRLMKTKFLNRNGYPSELKAAQEVFNTEDEYEIIGGSVHSSSSYYAFRGIPGTWNTVMFDVHWEDAADLLEHDYH
jgi:hypothetical protein